jgi:myosin heavy subunit
VSNTDISPSRTVFLIDTPGFDDTDKSDTQVLKEIATWLADSYRSKILLNGILYLHRITDLKMQGSARRNLIMFQQLCGSDALKKVILVTTMWDRVSAAEGAQREKELIDTPKFWGNMVEKGSFYRRHDNTRNSAMDIVHRLANHNAPVTTDLQRQLVDQQCRLDQTSAGRELQSELLKEKKKWAEERREIEAHMQAAIQKHDRAAAEMMREERDRYTRMIKKVEGDTDNLHSNMESLIAQRDKRVSWMKRKLEEQQNAHLKELRRVEERSQRLEEEKARLDKEREREKQVEREQERRAEREQKRQAHRERERQAQLQRERQAAVRERERQAQVQRDRQAAARQRERQAPVQRARQAGQPKESSWKVFSEGLKEFGRCAEQRIDKAMT